MFVPKGYAELLGEGASAAPTKFYYVLYLPSQSMPLNMLYAIEREWLLWMAESSGKRPRVDFAKFLRKKPLRLPGHSRWPIKDHGESIGFRLPAPRQPLGFENKFSYLSCPRQAQIYNPGASDSAFGNSATAGKFIVATLSLQMIFF